MILFRKKDIEDICEQAKSQYPYECCGVLLGVKADRKNVRVLALYKTANIQTQERKREHFLIDPLEIVRIEKEIQDTEIEIVGFYHSHPDCRAIASEEDEAQMIPRYVYLIVSALELEKGGAEIGEMNCFMKEEITDRSAIQVEFQIAD